MVDQQRAWTNISICYYGCKINTNKQINKQTSKQINKQTSKQASKQANKQANYINSTL